MALRKSPRGDRAVGCPDAVVQRDPGYHEIGKQYWSPWFELSKLESVMPRVPYEELDYRDGLYYQDGVRFTGVAAYVADGWIESEAGYKDGLLCGMKREWHGPGQLAREAECKFGARHGLCREWDDAGRLIAEHNYEFGVRVSGSRWNADEDLIEEFQIKESDPGYSMLQSMRNADESNDE